MKTKLWPHGQLGTKVRRGMIKDKWIVDETRWQQLPESEWQKQKQKGGDVQVNRLRRKPSDRLELLEDGTEEGV